MQGDKFVFCFDIDGIIFSVVNNLDYHDSVPIQDTIKLINKIYNEGHYIKLYTARGSLTKIDWIEFTKKQLKRNKVCYHELHFGKPSADYYIDDKLISILELKKMFS